jgi:hypothetical protein
MALDCWVKPGNDNNFTVMPGLDPGIQGHDTIR